MSADDLNLADDLIEALEPNRKDIQRVSRQLKQVKETYRLDFLSDGKIKFRYSLNEDGKCVVGWRGSAGTFTTLRDAIDYYMEHLDELKHTMKLLKLLFLIVLPVTLVAIFAFGMSLSLIHSIRKS